MNPTDCISQKRFGDVEVTVVRPVKLHWRPVFPEGQRWRTPELAVADDGRSIIDCNGLFARAKDAVVVIDPSGYRGDEDLSRLGIDIDVQCDAAETLAAAGIDPAEVTHVVITHGHGDHLNGVLDGGRMRFPNAVHVFPAADWNEQGADWYPEVRELLDPVDAAGLLRLIEGDVDLPGDISYVEAPGETAGHHVVRVGPVWYLGDLFHFATEIEHVDWAPEHVAERAMLEPARRRVLGQAAGATAIFSHAVFPAWGTVERAGDGWRWRYDA